jgi:hypothetical protein
MEAPASLKSKAPVLFFDPLLVFDPFRAFEAPFAASFAAS